MGKFKYSNFGFALLGKVIEVASGMPYEKYMEENFVKKLNLKNTFPDIEEGILNKLAVGYSGDLPGRRVMTFGQSKAVAYAPAAGFATNASDLLILFADLILSKKSKILSARSRNLMFRERSKINKNTFYGLGIEIRKNGGKNIYSHSGGYNGFKSNVIIDKSSGLCVAILSNSLNCNPQRISAGVCEFFKFLEAKNKKIKSIHGIKDSKIFEGVYRSKWGDILIINIEGKLLSIYPSLYSPFENVTFLKPTKNKNEFIIDTDDAFDYNGEIARFIFKGKESPTSLVWGSSVSNRVSL